MIKELRRLESMLYANHKLRVNLIWIDSSGGTNKVAIDMAIIESKTGKLAFDYDEGVMINGYRYNLWQMGRPFLIAGKSVKGSTFNFDNQGIVMSGHAPTFPPSKDGDSLRKHIYKNANKEVKKQHPAIVAKMDQANLDLKAIKDQFYVDYDKL